jgi:transcriptional regulator with XRE-family HTH domain
MEKSSVTASYNSVVAAKLRKLLERSPRTGAKTTYKMLAEYLDVKQQSVSSWANGTTIPDTKHIAPIAEYFSVDCDYLLKEGQTEYTRAAMDICRETSLAPEAVEILGIHSNALRTDEFFQVDSLSMSNFEIKALNHLIANCNSILGDIGLYLFGDIDGVEKVSVKGANINIVQVSEYIRNGILNQITTKLVNYRKLLLDNGGDLALTKVLDLIRAERKEQFITSRVEFLESNKGRPLTEAEIQQQRDLYDQPHKPTKELTQDLDKAYSDYVTEWEKNHPGKKWDITKKALFEQTIKLQHEEADNGKS